MILYTHPQPTIPVFGSNTFSTSGGSSYLGKLLLFHPKIIFRPGFHRPTLVVPPSSYSSKSSSSPSSSPSYAHRYQTNNMFRYNSFENSTGIIHWIFCDSSQIFCILGPALVFPKHYGLRHPAYGAYDYNVFWGGDLNQALYSNNYKLYDKYRLRF